MRFACELGFSIEESTWQAAKRNAPKLDDIAAERRRQEFVKILLTDARYPALGRDELRSPLRGLRLLDELDVWDFLVPEFNLARGMEQRQDHHRYDVLEHSFRVCAAAPPTEKLRLAALLHDVGKPDCKRETGVQYAHDKYGERISKRVLTDLRFPTRTITEVSALVDGHMYDIQHMAKTGHAAREVRHLGQGADAGIRFSCGRRISAAAGMMWTMWRTIGARCMTPCCTTARRFPSGSLRSRGSS